MDKFLYHKPKALSKENCLDIIDYFDSSKHYFKPTLNYHALNGSLIDKRFFCVKQVLEKALFEYGKKFSVLESYSNLWGVDTDFNIQKYDIGKAYASNHALGYDGQLHCEDLGSVECQPRILAWMFYLNTIKKGGGTYWPYQNFKSKPRQGSLFIWPAGWTHSHRGIIAPKEEKYIITGWCKQHNEMCNKYW